jgi:hypothetical protein
MPLSGRFHRDPHRHANAKTPQVKVQRRPQLGILETSLLSVNVMETDFPAGLSVPPLARANTLRSLMRLD